MLQRIHIENFKSLRDVELKLGRMNLFLGSNASGKSNFLDALRVLQGIGNGFTIHEILDGKPKSATSEVWDGIRGGSARACFENGNSSGEVRFSIEGGLDPDILHGASWRYELGFSPASGRVVDEELSVGEDIFSSKPVGNATTGPVLAVRYWSGQRGAPRNLQFERTRPVLAQIAKGVDDVAREHVEAARGVARAMADMQRIDPVPLQLRMYSQAHSIQRMGERGENFAALVRAILDDGAAKQAYLSWLQQLRPDVVDDVGTLSGAVGEPMFMLRESGREFPAAVLSDGTLRFAAITAALFQPDMPATMMIEELENGVHPDRLRLLVELLRSRARYERPQVMATTHSPTVLAWLTSEEHRSTYFCKRVEGGESRICPLPEIPHFEEVAKKHPVGDLLAEGWMEAAL